MITSTPNSSFYPNEQESEKKNFSISVYVVHKAFISLLFCFLISVAAFVAVYVLVSLYVALVILILVVSLFILMIISFFFPSLHVVECLVSKRQVVVGSYAYWKCCKCKIKLSEKRLSFDRVLAVYTVQETTKCSLGFTTVDNMDFDTQVVFPADSAKEFYSRVEPYVTKETDANHNVIVPFNQQQTNEQRITIEIEKEIKVEREVEENQN